MEHIALVSGADRGLGHALSAGLLERGWRVYAGQYMPEWPELAALAERYPDTLRVIPLDVSSTASVQAAVQAVAQTTGHIDLLISNAGVSARNGRNPIREPQDYEGMLRAYDVNALGALRMI